MPLEAAHWGGTHGPAPIICATSGWNALGFTPHQIWAFRRAELTAFAESPFRCNNGERATMAFIRELHPKSFGLGRLQPIASALVQEFVPSLSTVGRDAKIAVIVGLPERFARVQGATDNTYLNVLETAVTEPLVEAGFSPLVQFHPRGHASLAHSILDAGVALMTRTIDIAIVGGVDTYYDPDTFDALLERGTLFDGENLDSFIPGEGGAFLLLTRSEIARKFHWPMLARVESAVTNQEPASMLSDLDCAGLGLSNLLLTISDRVRKENRLIDWWLGDLTNEAYRVHEFQLAFPRASARATREGCAIEFLPPLLGDLGAATMPTAAVIGIEGFLRGDPAATNCLLSGSSVGPDRGAILLAPFADSLRPSEMPPPLSSERPPPLRSERPPASRSERPVSIPPRSERPVSIPPPPRTSKIPPR